MTKSARLAATLVLLTLATAGLSAQQSGAVAVAGVVLDQTGAILPDAQVEMKAADGGSVQTAATDAAGRFSLQAPRPGRYDVAVTRDGFEPTTSRVTVGTRPPAALRITLPLARVKQDVTVGNSPAQVRTDAASNLDASTVDAALLSQLPVFNQDILATMTRFLDSTAIGTGATLIVNGMEVSSLMVPASAIQQVRINSDPYSAEFFRPGRGRIEVITKPGSQQYEGTLNLTLRDAALDTRNAFAAAKPAESRQIAEGFIGGPVGHSDKTSFTASARRDSENSQGIIVAQDLSGPIQQNAPTPSLNVLASLTVTHQHSARTTMALTGSYLYESTHNQGVGGVTLPTAGVNWNTTEQETTYSQQTVITSHLLNQFRFLVGQEYETWSSVSTSPSLVVLDSFTGGGAQADHYRTEHHFTLTDTVTWSPGRHVVKIGLNIPDWSRRRWDDNTNRGGTFYFSSLADFDHQRPYAFTEQTGDGHVVFLDKQVGAFVQDDFRIKPNLSLSAGLRYDWQNYSHDVNNFAPRMSFAFAPASSGATVIRGGAGVFYDRTGANPIQDILRYDGHRLLRVVLEDPAYPDPFAAGGSAATDPPSVVRFASDLVIPFNVQYGMSVERQLRKGTSASVSYTGTRGFDQFRSRDVNAPLPPLFVARPDPTLGAVREIESAGKLVSHSVQFSLRGQLTRFAAGSVQYTFSHTKNDTGGINWMPPSSYDLSLEYARADSDQRHRFDMLAAFNSGSLFNLGIAVALYSGRPYSVTTGLDAFNTGVANARPDGVPRNSLQGPGYADVDLRWSHDFKLSAAKSGGKAFTVGVDAFNVLNRVNDTRYIGTITSPFFGRAISAQPPRRLQASARFRF